MISWLIYFNGICTGILITVLINALWEWKNEPR